jgi:hypothetical protein
LIALIINIHPLGVNGHCSLWSVISSHALHLRETHMTERPALLYFSGPNRQPGLKLPRPKPEGFGAKDPARLTNVSHSDHLQDLHLEASRLCENRMSACSGLTLQTHVRTPMITHARTIGTIPSSRCQTTSHESEDARQDRISWTISGVELRQNDRLGGASRDRTDDLMLAKHALSQLSYGPQRLRHRKLSPSGQRSDAGR